MRSLVLFATSLLTSLVAAAGSSAEQTLTNWVSAGTSFDVLTVGGLRGVYAREAISSESELMSVAEEFMITSLVVSRSPDVIAVIEDLDGAHINSPVFSAFSIFLLAERAAGAASAFAPYIASLPTSFAGSPYFWQDGSLEMSLLKGTSLPHKIAESRAEVRSDYALIAAKSQAFGVRHSLDSYEWAYACVSSRVFNVEIDGEYTRALVPVADLLNHGRASAVGYWIFDSSRRVFVIPITRDIPAGAECVWSYGDKSNAHLLLHYGFAVPKNADDESLEVLSLPFVNVRSLLPKNLWTRSKLQRLPAEGPSVLETTTWYSAVQTRTVFSYLRFVHAESVELDDCPESIDQTTLADSPIPFLSMRNEARVLATLALLARDALELLDAPAPATLEKAAAESFNVANARLIAAGEADIARFFVRLDRDVASIANAAEARQFLLRLRGRNQTHEDAAIAQYVSAVILSLGDFSRDKKGAPRADFRAYEL